MTAFSKQDGVEQRARRRFRCEGSAEIRLQANGPRQQWAMLTDLSESGCYLKTATPLPVGQQIVLKLNILGWTLVAQSRVTVMHPMFGMGVVFTSLSPETKATLQEIITQLARVANGSLALPNPPAKTPALKPRTIRLSGEAAMVVLNKISQRLAEHGRLTKEEFLAMMEEPDAGRQGSGGPGPGQPFVTWRERWRL